MSNVFITKIHSLSGPYKYSHDNTDIIQHTQYGPISGHLNIHEYSTGWVKVHYIILKIRPIHDPEQLKCIS